MPTPKRGRSATPKRRRGASKSPRRGKSPASATRQSRLSAAAVHRPQASQEDDTLTSILGVVAKAVPTLAFFGVFTYIELEVVSRRQRVPGMVDHGFGFFQPVNDWLRAMESAAGNQSLLVSALLFADTIFLSTVAALATFTCLCSQDFTCGIAMILCHCFRSACMLTVELPTPKHIIWRKPGFPSDGENDYFFSGHVALPLIGAIELWRMGYKKASVVFHSLNLLQVVFMLVLQLHYTVDLVTGLMAGFTCYYLVSFGGDAAQRPFAYIIIFMRWVLQLGPLNFSDESCEVVFKPSFDPGTSFKIACAVVLGNLCVLYLGDAF